MPPIVLNQDGDHNTQLNKTCVGKELDVELAIHVAHTVAYPWTVVVVKEHALVTGGAVAGAWHACILTVIAGSESVVAILQCLVFWLEAHVDDWLQAFLPLVQDWTSYRVTI